MAKTQDEIKSIFSENELGDIRLLMGQGGAGPSAARESLAETAAIQSNFRNIRKSSEFGDFA